MAGDQLANLLYLSVLGLVIGGWVFASARHNWGQMAQYAAIWGFIFLGVIVAVVIWSDIRDTVLGRQVIFDNGARVEIPLANDGHYHITIDVNNVDVEFIIDTGATDIVLSQQDAMRVGLDIGGLSYTGRAFTANGQVETAPIFLEAMTLGDFTDRNVFAVVNRGLMQTSLLGMQYLQRFDHIEIRDGRLILTRE